MAIDRKRILIISPHYPPFTTPAGLHAFYKARGLARLDWEVDVLTSGFTGEEGNVAQGWGLSEAAGVHVIRTAPPLARVMMNWLPKIAPGPTNQSPAISPAHSSSASINAKPTVRHESRFARPLSLLLYPDRMGDWIPVAYATLRRDLYQRPYQIVMSLAAPWTAHCVSYLAHGMHSRRLDAALNARALVLDYGEAWSLDPYLDRPAFWRPLDRAVERQILQHASAVLFHAKSALKRYEADWDSVLPKKRLFLTLAYAADEVETAPAAHFERFTIAQAGVLSYNVRNPHPLIEALAELFQAGVDFQFISLGPVSTEVRKHVSQSGLQEAVQFPGYVSHPTVLSTLKGAQVLILIGNKTNLQVPSKVYELLGIGRPVLSIYEDPQDEAARMVLHYGMGYAVPNEPSAIRDVLRQSYTEWLGGANRAPKPNPQVQEDHSWDTRCVALDAFLRDVIH